jgi:tetratricopeptide (TPR) repeat protein
MKVFAYIFIVFCLFACDEKEKQAPAPVVAINKAESTDEALLKTELAKYPDSSEVLQKLIQYYVANSNYDAALSSVNNALMRDSMNHTLWDLKSIIAAEKGDTATSIKSLENAITIYPIPEYIISLGALYAETGNPLALEMADALIVGSKSKSEKEAYFIKGLYYSFKNEKEKSIPFFDKAMITDYTFVQAYLEKGLALYDLKKYEEASKVLEKSVQVQTKFDKGYFYLGQCYEKLQRPQEAIEVYQIALQLDPDYEEVKDALARLGIK